MISHRLTVGAAVVKPLNDSLISQQKSEVVPQTAANTRNEVVFPLMSSNADRSGPYYDDPSRHSYPQSNLYSQERETHERNHPLLKRGDEFRGDRRLPMEQGDYYDYEDTPSGAYHDHMRPTEKPKKLYKAIERVYYYPQDGDGGDIAQNKDAMKQMQQFIPDEPDYDDDTQEDDPQDDPPLEIKAQKDYHQMNENPPRGDHEEPEEAEVYESDGSGTQSSIANDAQKFGREAVDDAKTFETFLDNLRHFADNSEKEYSSPYGKDQDDGDDGESGDSRTAIQDSDDSNPNYSESLAAQAGDDRTSDYEKVGNYGNPDEYDLEKGSYQRQRDRSDEGQRGGHRYHKDRRRPKRPTRVSEEEYDRRNKEVSGLIDSEPDEGDYLSNFDVVKQMKNSEKKYNTGVDPVYSSQRDFDEVKRLEKMIENVALLNKQKEKKASVSHDRSEGREGPEGREGSETKTEIITVKKDDDKEKSEKNEEGKKDKS